MNSAHQAIHYLLFINLSIVIDEFSQIEQRIQWRATNQIEGRVDGFFDGRIGFFKILADVVYPEMEQK
jgi:hypothetical protein